MFVSTHLAKFIKSWKTIMELDNGPLENDGKGDSYWKSPFLRFYVCLPGSTMLGGLLVAP